MLDPRCSSCPFSGVGVAKVNAVFVQQTIKTASSDEELAYKQKVPNFEGSHALGEARGEDVSLHMLLSNGSLPFFTPPQTASLTLSEASDTKACAIKYVFALHPQLYVEDAVLRKERDIAVYTRKVKNLFHTLDTSGDGNIDQDEFAQLVDSPMLKFWMSQLELEYHDLLSLFDYLDNGDGEITLVEFIEGATRLRGSAKALDIWRMEAKVESLFDQLLEVLQAK